MKFQTEVNIESPSWQLMPADRLLFVGSCFAATVGKRFVDNLFQTTVNPFGVMYNPVSILHTLQRLYNGQPTETSEAPVPDVAFLTLGTNHVYRLKATGQIVDNCEKRPQRLFQEEQLSVDACADALRQCISLLQRVNPQVRIVLTVSPIRYAKYGFHGSQLSKATLLLAVEQLTAAGACDYFPAYEIVNDELRDYRFYAPDMLHPSEQTADYIWLRLTQTMFSHATLRYIDEWEPLHKALQHKPFQPASEEYRRFMEQTHQRLQAFQKKYPHVTLPSLL